MFHETAIFITLLEVKKLQLYGLSQLCIKPICTYSRYKRSAKTCFFITFTLLHEETNQKFTSSLPLKKNLLDLHFRKEVKFIYYSLKIYGP